jgi:hypothetical protein
MTTCQQQPQFWGLKSSRCLRDEVDGSINVPSKFIFFLRKLFLQIDFSSTDPSKVHFFEHLFSCSSFFRKNDLPTLCILTWPSRLIFERVAILMPKMPFQNSVVRSSYRNNVVRKMRNNVVKLMSSAKKTELIKSYLNLPNLVLP